MPVADGTSLALASADTSSADIVLDQLDIIQLGAVLDLEPESATPSVWHDESGNGLDGVVTGATLVNLPHFANTDYGPAAVKQELVDSSSSKPGYYCDGVSNSIQLTLPTNLGNGVGSDGPFSFLMLGSGNLMFGGTGSSFNYINFKSSNVDGACAFSAYNPGSQSINRAATVIEPVTSNRRAIAFTNPGGDWVGCKLYINGSPRTPTITEPAGTYLGGPSSVVMTIGAYATAYWYKGEYNRLVYFNYQLSEDKVRKYSAGAKLDFEDVGGSMTDLLAAGTWNNNGYSTYTPSGRQVTAAIASGTAAVYMTSFTAVAGKKYRLNFSVTMNSGKTIYPTVLLVNTSYVTSSNTVQTSSTTSYAELTSTYTGTVWVYVSTTGDANYTFAVTSMVQLGAVLDLEPESATPSIWHDESGNQIDGTVTGATLINLPHFAMTDYGSAAVKQELMDSSAGASYKFFGTGNTNKISIADTSNLSFTSGGMSIVAQAKADVFNPANSSNIVTKTSSSSNCEYLFCVVAGAGANYLRFTRYADSAGNNYATQIGTVSIPTGAWKALAVTVPNVLSGSSNLWVDGIQVPTTTSVNLYTGMQDLAGPFTVGGWDGTASETWNGLIGRVLMFNYQLSEDKVRKYSAGSKLDFEDVGGTQVLYSAANAGSPWNEANATTGWAVGYSGGSFTSTSGTAHTGSYHLAFAGTGNGSRMDYAFPVQTGKTYRVSLWSRDATSAIVYVSPTNAGDNLGSAVAASVPLNSSATYTETVYTFVAASTGTFYLSIRATALSSGKVDSVIIAQLGAVLDLEPEGITSTKWFDQSPNALHGSVSGAKAATLAQCAKSYETMAENNYTSSKMGVATSSDGSANVLYMGRSSSSTDTWFLQTKSVTVVIGGSSGWIVILGHGGAGQQAALFMTYSSATVTEVADPAACIDAADGGSRLFVSKAANSYSFTIKNNWTNMNLVISVIGASVDSISNPA
jgi:hypothetical protein